VSKKEVPDILYRYRPMRDDYDFASIEQGYLYFSKSDAFNDPFEFAAKESIEIPNPQTNWAEFSVLNNEFFKLKDDQIIPLLLSGKLSGMLELQEKVWMDAITEWHLKKRDQVFCCCFSKNNDHPLMWGHYANGLRGLAIGFKSEELAATSEFPVKDVIREVNYSEDNSIPHINYSAFLVAQADKDLAKEVSSANFSRKFCTKSTHWEYESEYRMLWQSERDDWDQKVKYSEESVSEVIFGELMLTEERKRVMEAFKDKNVSFKQAIRSGSHYSLEIVSL